MREILTKTCFSPQSEPHTAKLCFSVVLKDFRGNSQRTSLFSQKSGFSEKSKEILKKLVLKGSNPEDNFDLFKQLFLMGGLYHIFRKFDFFSSPCHNFFPLSSVQIIIIPACCLLCVL